MHDREHGVAQDLARVCAIVARQLGVESVAPEMRLIEDLSAESIDLVSIAGALERELGVILHDEALFDIETVHDLARAVAQARERPAP
jgi:acyl carrier protein